MKYAKYSSGLKERLVLEYQKGEKSLAKIAEENSINKNTLSSWVKRSREIQEPVAEGKLIELTNALGEISAPPEIVPDGMVRFRINGTFDIEVAKASLPEFLEAMKNAGGR